MSNMASPKYCYIMRNLVGGTDPTSKLTSLSKYQYIKVKYVTSDVTFLLASKMVGLISSPTIFQELMIRWGGNPPFPAANSTNFQLYYVLTSIPLN